VTGGPGGRLVGRASLRARRGDGTDSRAAGRRRGESLAGRPAGRLLALLQGYDLVCDHFAARYLLVEAPTIKSNGPPRDVQRLQRAARSWLSALDDLNSSDAGSRFYREFQPELDELRCAARILVEVLMHFPEREPVNPAAGRLLRRGIEHYAASLRDFHEAFAKALAEHKEALPVRPR